MLTLSRRGLLVAGGTSAAGVALSACGAAADPRADASPTDLAQAELTAELSLNAAYGQAAGALESGAQRTALESFATAAKARAEQLRQFVAEPTASSSTGSAADGGPATPEALAGAIAAANTAIAAHRQASGLLDSIETRALASSSLAACAAELAAVGHFAGRPEVPDAFVTGGEARPYQASGSSASTSTTSSSGESSTTTGSTATTTGAP